MIGFGDGGEVSGALRGGRHQAGTQVSGVLWRRPSRYPRRKSGSGGSGHPVTAELIAMQRRLGQGPPGIGIERRVADEFEGRAVEIVGAGARDDVNHAVADRPNSAL